ncbi:DUF1853 family protein [Burkholderia glumae]|uniref:DUF1853 family protein n=1 Tax=Burkholderia glumae TaxID=337 RepID=UPI0001A4B1F4|nr:DUF1853 family protein [Burkholderia glumae]ACR28407.1 Hypothetical protein bglu_1g12480 [Burkholderia glumae BGR1]
MTAVVQSVPWVGLRDTAVRDLGWLLASADLLAASAEAPLARPWRGPGEAARIAAWLSALDADPAPLAAALGAARPTRLGRYAEALLEFFAAQAPAWTLVAANLPVRVSGRTLGECDLLLVAPDGERLHWELAVKCYLCAAPDGTAALRDYVGPNLADRFDLKYRRLVDHQLRLSARDEFAFAGQPGPWAARMLVKGWLFYRDGAAVTAPAALDPAHSRGFWTPCGNWPSLAARQPAGTSWVVLPRLAWLAPRRFEDAGQDGALVPLDATTLFEAVRARPAPCLVAAVRRGEDGAWHEMLRGFIVDDGWPARVHAFAAPQR